MMQLEAWRLAAFVAGTLTFLYVSRRSLNKPASHGFYRFFAWELMLALGLYQAPVWFDSWLAWHQIISWVLLIACIVPLVMGIYALRHGGGQPDEKQRQEPELLGFERTTQLVTEGIYHYIRHPLYSSLFILNWGIFFKNPSWLGGALAAGASLLLVATARADEAECLQAFGTDYLQYMKQTRRFIPYIY